MKALNPRQDPDPLSDALGAVRFQSTIFCRSEMTAPWGFGVSGRDIATFHLVERGECWLEVTDVPGKTRLAAGDLVLLPHGHAHVLRDRPRSPVTHLEDLLAGRPAEEQATLSFGGGGAATALLCGGFRFDNRDAVSFLPALPPVLVVESNGRAGSWLSAARGIIESETVSHRPGENTILCRVADLFFVEAVRSYFSDASGGPRGWFAALRDRHIGRAISLIHREPKQRWTVGSLAAAVGMSRSAFALRFSVLLGESPIRYLARGRITRACSLLESDELTVARIADEVGYESNVAFSRAFKRHVGVSPVDYRRAARSASRTH